MKPKRPKLMHEDICLQMKNYNYKLVVTTKSTGFLSCFFIFFYMVFWCLKHVNKFTIVWYAYICLPLSVMLISALDYILPNLMRFYLSNVSFLTRKILSEHEGIWTFRMDFHHPLGRESIGPLGKDQSTTAEPYCESSCNCMRVNTARKKYNALIPQCDLIWNDAWKIEGLA